MTTNDDGDPRQRAMQAVIRVLTTPRSSAGGPFGLDKAAMHEALDALKQVDPDLQRRVAKTLVTTRGDVEAIRAAMDDAAPVKKRIDTAAHVASRPPTVVDARGSGSRLGVLVALVLAALAAWLLADAQ